MRGTVFAGWGAGGRELTREIIVPAPQARRPTLRRPFDAPQPQAIHQPRGADSYDGVREEETSAEVRGVAQDREGGRGRRGRGWVARVAGTCAGGFFGRLFAVAVPRTLRNPFSLFRHDCSGGHDPPD